MPATASTKMTDVEDEPPIGPLHLTHDAPRRRQISHTAEGHELESDPQPVLGRLVAQGGEADRDVLQQVTPRDVHGHHSVRAEHDGRLVELVALPHRAEQRRHIDRLVRREPSRHTSPRRRPAAPHLRPSGAWWPGRDPRGRSLGGTSGATRSPRRNPPRPRRRRIHETAFPAGNRHTAPVGRPLVPLWALLVPLCTGRPLHAIRTGGPDRQGPHGQVHRREGHPGSSV